MNLSRSLARTESLRAAVSGISPFDLLLFVVVFIWGINFSVVKGTLSEMTPLAFNGVRFFLASVTMLVLARVIQGNLDVERGDWGRLAVAGLIGHTAYQLFFIIGIDHTQAGHSALSLGMTPVFVALIGFLLGIERVRGRVWVGIILSFAGIMLISSGSTATASGDAPSLFGDVLSMSAALCWATYTVLSKPLLGRYSPLQFTAVTMAIGAAPMLVLSIPSVAAQDWSRVSTGGWLGLLFSYSLAIVGAYVVWYTSVQRVGTARTAIFANLQPVIGLATAWVALGETMSAIQWIGAAVVIVGVSLARRS